MFLLRFGTGGRNRFDSFTISGILSCSKDKDCSFPSHQLFFGGMRRNAGVHRRYRVDKRYEDPQWNQMKGPSRTPQVPKASQAATRNQGLSYGTTGYPQNLDEPCIVMHICRCRSEYDRYNSAFMLFQCFTISPARLECFIVVHPFNPPTG